MDLLSFDSRKLLLTGLCALSAALPLQAQYCTPVVTSPGSANHISRVKLDVIDNQTGSSSYSDFSSSLTATLVRGKTYSITVRGGSYNDNRFRAWIDYDQNQSFNTSNEEVGVVNGIGANPAQGNINFTVPLSAPLGESRMRVRVRSNTSNACATSQYGEAEDYGIYITPGGITTSGTCPGATLSFEYVAAGSETVSSITWYRNGEELNEISEDIIADEPGAYEAIFETDEGDSWSTNIININQRPSAKITTTGVLGLCPGASVHFEIASYSPYYAYEWYDGATLIGNTGPGHTATTAGNYTVQVHSYLTGCSSVSINRPVTEKPAPAASIDVASTTICDGSSITFHAPVSDPGYIYAWKKDGVKVGTKDTFVVKKAGHYTLRTTLAGCVSESDTTVIAVSAPDVTTVTEDQTTFCAGGQAELKAVNDPGYSYQWLKGTAVVSGATDREYIATESGNYKVRITDALGCVKTTASPIVVKANPIPAATITMIGNPNSGMVTLKGYPRSTGCTYEWYETTQGLVGTGADLVVSASGDYTVLVTRNSCTGTSGVNTVNIPAPAMRISEAGASISIYPNPSPDGFYHIEAQEAVNVRVTDLQGHLLLQTENTVSVDMRTYAPGVYMLFVMDDKGNLLKTEKLVKE
jgi:hypothetical protein